MSFNNKFNFMLPDQKPFSMLALFLADFYKMDHNRQYPAGITRVYSNWTPRKSRVPGVDKVVVFGHQYFVIRYLIQEFNNNFFNQPLEEVLDEYRRVIRATLKIQNPPTDHIEKLHKIGYLPLTMFSLPEGTSVNINIPSMVMYNTHDDAAWVPNFLETVMSMTIWVPATSATNALQFRKLFMKYAKMAGETDFTFVDYQGHDFSMRGMGGFEDAILSGMGHLSVFNGTDTIPAILAAEYYYGADIASTGTSVPATEHSVVCAGSKDGEYLTFERLIKVLYPEGPVSIVSDTWDLWEVLTKFIPSLKEDIVNRKGGPTVFRPDSGEPVEITIGKNGIKYLNSRITKEPFFPVYDTPADEGVIALLAKTLGFEDRAEGLPPLIKNGKEIYGDSITLERADRILDGIVNYLGLSPYNMIFGIGSYVYRFVTRDTFGFAMKGTEIIQNGKNIPIFKDPITDSGFKKSVKGIPIVDKADDWTPENPNYVMHEMGTQEELENCAMEKIFEDGKLLSFTTFETIKERVRVQSN
jgi:nicotinamide phosphoribosyltransferase